ncbi:hypothetical protein LJC00_02965 [Dysgonomonas sp. OttesenSCG-928-M03]|nr:hypothetical protein [Dysgonomonas sp. OttesenSCG-928-M03]
MKRNIFNLFILTIVLGIGLSFTSCDDDDRGYWVEGYLDVDISYTTDNSGNFLNSPYAYDFRDLKVENGGINLSKVDVTDIRLTDAWIELYSAFRSGDQIDGLTIWIDGVGSFTCPTYRFASSQSKLIIDDETAPGFYNFMQQAIRVMAYKGVISVYIGGNYNVRHTNIDVVLKNNLDILIEKY